MGDTWLTTTTVPSPRAAPSGSANSSSHASRTLVPAEARLSPPGGTNAGSARHRRHTSAGMSVSFRPSYSP